MEAVGRSLALLVAGRLHRPVGTDLLDGRGGCWPW